MAKMTYARPGATSKINFSAIGVANQVKKNIRAAMRTVSEELATLIAQAAPVDTGDLEASIRVRPVTGPNARFEVSTIHYGKFVEEGTVKMAAQPFIRPIMVDARRLWEREIRREARRLSRGL